jgi:hypothetical protein
MNNNTVRYAERDAQRTVPGSGAPGEPRRAVTLRRLSPGMRRLLFTASVLVLLAGIQLFIFTGRTDSFFAFTIPNPLAAAFLGAAYLAAVPIEALAGRQALWANARIAVPAVLVFTVLTLAVTVTHLDQLHLGARFAAGTQLVTVAWIAIYVLVPALMLILLAVQARIPGADPPRSAGLPAWLYVVLAVQAIVLLGVGIALFAMPGRAAPLWPWKLTPMMAQATGAWLISLGVAAGHALLERDARRLRPAAAGSILLAVLLSIALARYPHQFEWRSASGVVYLIFLVMMLLTGAVSLARGLPRVARRSAPGPATAGETEDRYPASLGSPGNAGDTKLAGREQHVPAAPPQPASLPNASSSRLPASGGGAEGWPPAGGEAGRVTVVLPAGSPRATGSRASAAGAATRRLT